MTDTAAIVGLADMPGLEEAMATPEIKEKLREVTAAAMARAA